MVGQPSFGRRPVKKSDVGGLGAADPQSRSAERAVCSAQQLVLERCQLGTMRPRNADPAPERGRRVLFGGLAVGLVIVVAAAVVWLRPSGSHGRGSRPASVLAGAIAWVNRPAPETQAPPLPRPVFPSGPRCGLSALRFIGTQGGGATGNAVYRVTLRNVSSHPCEVRGYPRAVAVSADGSVRTLQVRHGSFFGTPGPVAAAAPGQVVGVNLDGSGSLHPADGL